MLDLLKEKEEINKQTFRRSVARVFIHFFLFLLINRAISALFLHFVSNPVAPGNTDE